MKKLIIHIGYSKTATTSLQLNLFASLREAGKLEYLNHLNRKEPYLGNLYCRNIISYITGMGNLDKCKTELLKINEIKHDISIISAETLSTFCEDFSWGNLNSQATDNATRIKNIFMPYFDKICIIMTIRAQQTLVPSAYAQWYTQIQTANKSTTLSHWINDSFLHKKEDSKLMFNFYKMYSAYRHQFGSDNVNVLLYEDLLYDKKFFYNQLAVLLEITPSNLALLLETTNKNKTLMSDNNRLVVEAPTYNDIFLRNIKKPLKILLPKRIFTYFRTVYRLSIGRMLATLKIKKIVHINSLTTYEKTAIQKRFHDTNFKLGKTLGLDIFKLKKYGYLGE